MTDLLTPGEENIRRVTRDNSDILEELRQIELKEKLKKKTQKKIEKVEEVKTPIIQPIKEDVEDFIYVPSINLYVAKERSFLGKSWVECQVILHKKNQKMLNLLEFIEFLKYTKINHKDIYEELAGVTSFGAEWLNAYFKYNNDELYIQYHIFENNKIKLIKEKLDKNTLMEDKKPGISLENYINENHTSQGFPNSKVNSGNLSYWFPRRDNKSVVMFIADSSGTSLNCYRDSTDKSWNLGVRVCTLNPKEKK